MPNNSLRTSPASARTDSEPTVTWIPARRRRLLAAAYIDYLIFSVFWAYSVAVVDRLLPGYAEQPWFVPYLVFSVIELLVLGRITVSPGTRILGIRFVEAEKGQVGVDRLWRNRIPFVDACLHEAESWFSLLVGVYLLLEASKTLVRWTMFSPPLPFFGMQPEGAAGGFVSIAIGSVEAYVAYNVLRVHRRALLVGGPFYAFMAASAIVSWGLWDDWAERYIVGRRAYQGVPVRPGEIESFQAVAPKLLVIALIFNVSVLLFLSGRLRRDVSKSG